MNYHEWDIIEDDYPRAQKAWESGNQSWCLVNCKVKWIDGSIKNWVLHYDEYMYRKLSKQLEQMNEQPVPQSVIDQTEKECQEWYREIKDREQGEEDAGEDL